MFASDRLIVFCPKREQQFKTIMVSGKDRVCFNEKEDHVSLELGQAWKILQLGRTEQSRAEAESQYDGCRQ
jgi:hypothetical protein